MRTTLAIDDDVLASARALARRERKSVGEVISALARQALRREPDEAPTVRNGVALLSRRDGATPVTLEMVNALRDASP